MHDYLYANSTATGAEDNILHCEQGGGQLQGLPCRVVVLVQDALQLLHSRD